MMMNEITRSNIRGKTTSEFITSYEWDFEFDKVPYIIGSNSLKNLRLRCSQVNTPEEPVSPNMSVNIRGHVFSQIGLVMHAGTFTIVSQDFSDTSVQQPLMKLMYAICDPTTKATIGSPRDFFFDCRIYQLNAKREIIKVWVCKDCLLQSVQIADDMTSEKNIIGQTNVMFSTDCFTVEYPVKAAESATDPTYYLVNGADKKSLK